MANRYPQQAAFGDHNDHGRAQRPVDNDPLRELARLIGQTDPNSNFAKQAPQPQAEPEYADHVHAGHEQFEPAPDQSGPSWMRTAQSGRKQQAIGGRATPQALAPAAAAYEQESLPLSQPPAFLRTARQQRETVPAPHYEPQYAELQHSEPQYQAHDVPYREPHAEAVAAHTHASARYDDALYGQNPANIQYQDQYQQGGYQDQHDQQYDPNAYQQYAEEQPEPRRKRGGLFTVGVVLSLAVVGTASAFAYRSYMGPSRSGEPPVIKAEPGANKIVPPQSADAGKINDRIGAANGPERVVAREEQPVDINARQQPRVVFPPLNQNSNPPSVQSVSTTAAIGVPAPATPAAAGEEPRRVRTTTIRPNEATAAAAATMGVRPPATTARAQVPANAPMPLAPQASTNAPVRTASVSPSASTGSTGGYVVQIASQRSEADAQASYRAMQSKFPNVLGSRSALIRRADLGERGIYYRAMVGPFGGAEDASNLCNSLKAAGGQCVVQRN